MVSLMNSNPIATEALNAALVAFLVNVNRSLEIYWKEQNFTFSAPPQVRVHTVGPRYIKLATYNEIENRGFHGELLGKAEYTAASVYCFVDKNNGDMFKGTWKSIVKDGKRGNLLDDNILSKFTIHGPGYLNCGGCYEVIANYLSRG